MGRSEEAKRLYDMILATGMRKVNFAKTLGMTQQSLNDYLDGTSDIKIISRKIFKGGYSVDWLYSGQGNMFFSSKKFEEKFEIPSVHNLFEQKERIKDWLLITFGSVENFRIERTVNIDLLDCLYNDDVIQHDLLIKLENAGCSLKWTITGIEPKYIENLNGKKLMSAGSK